MEAGSREMVERAGVIVVKMRDDAGIELFGIDADPLQGFAGFEVDLAAARRGFLMIETGIDQDRAVLVAQHEDEIVDRHRRRMIVRMEEIVRSGTVRHGAVLDG